MPKSVLIGMLKQATTGTELLQILEVLSTNAPAKEPTLKELTFWEVWVNLIGHSSWHLVAYMLKWQYAEFDSDFGGFVMSPGPQRAPPLF